MRFFWHVCFVVWVCAFSARADEPKPLERVPKDAALFIHVRVNNIFETAILKEVLKPLDAKVSIALLRTEHFQEDFGLGLQDLESLTLVLPRSVDDDLSKYGFVVLVTKKPYDKKKMIEKLKRERRSRDDCQEDGDPKPKKFPDNVMPLETKDFCYIFMGDREIILSHDKAVDMVLKLPIKETGPHLTTLKKAASGDYLAVLGYHPAAGVEESIPAEVVEELKPFMSAILPAHGEATLTMKKGIEVETIWTYANADKAKEGEKAINNAFQYFNESITDAVKDRHGKIAVGQLAMQFFTHLKGVKPKVEGKTVRVSFAMPIQKPEQMGKQIQEEIVYIAPRLESAQNLKNILVGFHNYESAQGRPLTAAICDNKGKPLLSWRVAILPYIEQDNLYNQFKLDEPWDSEHNIKLSKIACRTYIMPGVDDKHSMTRYRLFVGKGAMMTYDKAAHGLTTIPDGSSNTAAVFESADPVIWTKPDEMEFDPKKITTKMLYFDAKGKTNISFFDGSVALIEKKTLDRSLVNWIAPADGEGPSPTESPTDIPLLPKDLIPRLPRKD